MDIEKLIEQLRWWAENCDRTNYGCQARPFLLDDATALSTLQGENEKLRAELGRVKRENDALWTYIEIVDREYRRYMDMGYIDRLDELRKTWKCGQKED